MGGNYMSTTIYPWDLAQVPGYEAANTVESVRAENLDRKTFWHEFVLRNRPCLIKGAVASWLACHRWQAPEYLLSKIGDVEARASTYPKIERFGLRSEERDKTASSLTREKLLSPRPLSSILPKLFSPDHEVLFVELRPTDSLAQVLDDDLWVNDKRFTFLPHPPPPRFFYTVWAAMFYKNSYSDWHFHAGTDAIMCQVLGTKDVVLLPPDQTSWDQIVPVHREELKVYEVNLDKFPAYALLKPFRVVVRPGDGLFIPVNWWHAVQAEPRRFGVTVPFSWDTPYCDLRQPATRHFLRALWLRKKTLTAKMLAEATYRTVRTQLRNRKAS